MIQNIAPIRGLALTSHRKNTFLSPMYACLVSHLTIGASVGGGEMENSGNNDNNDNNNNNNGDNNNNCLN